MKCTNSGTMIQFTFDGLDAITFDAAATNPKKQQFEPTPAQPVRQHYKMAGGC